MRLRALLVVALVLLCARTSGRVPAAGPNRAPAVPQKAYPFSLRYRQQLDRQVRLPAPAAPAVPATRPADDRPDRAVRPAAIFPDRHALLSLLVRLQP